MRARPRRRAIGVAAAVVAAGAIAAAVALGAFGARDSSHRAEAPDAGVAPPDAASGPASGPASGSASGPASGPAAPASAADDAARLVDAAHAEIAGGHLVQARALLTRAFALDARPATLLELATVELQTGRCREAQRAAQRVAAAGEPLAAQAGELLAKIGRCD